MNNKPISFVLGFLSGVFIIFFAGYAFYNSDSIQRDFPQGYRIISPEVPKELDFCGEAVPLENFEVYERIDREIIVNTYFHSATIISIKRAKRWFPVVETILDEYGVPDDFKYLMVAESGMSNAVSPLGATGFWQLMEGAALEYGLEVNDEVDERYHIEKSTEATCKYLHEAYILFGTWTLAAASFNMGIPGVEKQIERQKAKNYYNLVLGEETSRYIARIIALKEIMNSPEKFGFDVKEVDLYNELSYNEIVVSGPIADLADFAIEHGINYKVLKLYNPWLRENFLTNKIRKTYKIKIPERGSIEIIEDNIE